MRYDIRLAGFGGQGVILAGHLLGKAAAVYGGKDAVLTQSYGPEARGGACAAQLIISDTPVDFPLVDKADCLALMSQEAYDKYLATAKEEAVILLDSNLVWKEPGSGRVYRAPFTRVAQGLGNRIVANMVMLGFLVGITGCVERAAVEEAIRTEMRPRFVDLNLEALARGFAAAGGLEVPSWDRAS